jgi:hypothetical protein
MQFEEQYLYSDPPFSLGAKIGAGYDGIVFELRDEPNRVIKFSGNIDLFENAWLIHSTQPKHFVSVFDFGSLDNVVGFFVKMERLLPLTEDERKLFHTLLSHEDFNKQKQFCKSTFDILSNYLDFDRQKAEEFCLLATSGPIVQRDLHERNIMKSKDGHFKIVDLDRLEILLP